MSKDQDEAIDTSDDAEELLPEDEPPDESTLMGKAGVEEEVLAELARAEGELNDASAEGESDSRGAQV
ncbi:MAG: hypothetical protein ABR498_03625 [Candidatus Dormibacteria bacterium]